MKNKKLILLHKPPKNETIRLNRHTYKIVHCSKTLNGWDVEIELID